MMEVGDDGGGHLVRMEWRLAGWSVCLPLLIFPCTLKCRGSLLAPAHPGGPGNKGREIVVCLCVCYLHHPCTINCLLNNLKTTKERNGKEQYLYSAFLAKVVHSKRSGMDHSFTCK